MKIAIAFNSNRVASIFSGVELCIIEFSGKKRKYRAIQTSSWVYMEWGKELMRCNVDLLVCGGIELFLYGLIQGFGISVVPNVIGTVDQAINDFVSGKLEKNKSWPHCSRANAKCGLRCKIE